MINTFNSNVFTAVTVSYVQIQSLIHVQMKRKKEEVGKNLEEERRRRLEMERK